MHLLWSSSTSNQTLYRIRKNSGSFDFCSCRCRSSPILSKTICVPCNNRSCGKRPDEIISNCSDHGKSLRLLGCGWLRLVIDLWIILVKPFQKTFFCPFIYFAIKSFLIINVFECFLIQWVKLFEVREEIGFNMVPEYSKRFTQTRLTMLS